MCVPAAQVQTKDLRVCFHFQSESCSVGLSHTATREEELMEEGGGQTSETGASADQVNNNDACGGDDS